MLALGVDAGTPAAVVPLAAPLPLPPSVTIAACPYAAWPAPRATRIHASTGAPNAASAAPAKATLRADICLRSPHAPIPSAKHAGGSSASAVAFVTSARPTQRQIPTARRAVRPRLITFTPSHV